MTTAEKVAGLTAWYEGRELIAPIPYLPGQIIQDPAKFVANQLQALKISPERTRMFRNAYMRLYQLKQYLSEHAIPEHDESTPSGTCLEKDS